MSNCTCTEHIAVNATKGMNKDCADKIIMYASCIGSSLDMVSNGITYDQICEDIAGIIKNVFCAGAATMARMIRDYDVLPSDEAAYVNATFDLIYTR